MAPKFIYFDLGNVLLHFSHARMCQQMADVLGTDAAALKTYLFAPAGPEEAFESGRVSEAEFLAGLAHAFGGAPDREALLHASSDIFELNVSIVPVVGHLVRAGYRLGILSNTNAWHWEWILRRRYAILSDLFSVHALSFEIGSMKPQPEIFTAAASLAGVAPAEIFYIDDIAGHVAAASAAGFHAVQYTSTPKLAEALRAAGVRFQY